jgi:hypothetical protein
VGCYGLGFTGAGKGERRYLEAEFEGEPGKGLEVVVIFWQSLD